jgi:ATP-binding cassette subfamily B protein
VTDEEVTSAAKLSSADEFIRALPGGYDFVIGDNGCRLSAGQRQRIAIARAVMLDPAYLLLDEATCNMDVYAEKQVTEALMRLMAGRTTVMISHDMRMLNRADQVVVLGGGTVEAALPREEAITFSPTLQKLIAAEAGKGDNT